MPEEPTAVQPEVLTKVKNMQRVPCPLCGKIFKIEVTEKLISEMVDGEQKLRLDVSKDENHMKNVRQHIRKHV